MKILKIDWMDSEHIEGILTLSTDGNLFEVFCHPCKFKEGDEIRNPIHAGDPENIFRVEPQQTYIKKIGNAFRHEVLGRVEDIKIPLIHVGDIKIELGGRLPGDISQGEFVIFQTVRLDAYS
jgi:hypothetical protein